MFCVPGCPKYEGYGYGNVSVGSPFTIALVKFPISLAETPQPALVSVPSMVSMNRPYPPRITVLPSEVARQANPTRGAKLVFGDLCSCCGIPAWLAVRIGVGAIDAAKSGCVSPYPASGTTATPCTCVPFTTVYTSGLITAM